jgi:plasmid stabilization system protein ParE
MAKKPIVWTETAVKQRREILKFWTLRNKSSKYSEKLVKLIANRLKAIQNHPESYKQTNFPGTRISAMGYFSILYKITDEQLIVTAFWDNRQDPVRLLKLLS